MRKRKRKKRIWNMEYKMDWMKVVYLTTWIEKVDESTLKWGQEKPVI